MMDVHVRNINRDKNTNNNILRIFRFFNRNRIPIIFYHGVIKDKKLKGIENYQGKHVFVDDFFEQMRFLKSNYYPIPLKNLASYLISGAALPRKSVVITLDDGYLNNYEIVFPILKTLSIPATIFLTTDFINLRKPLWPDRVEYVLSNISLNEIDLSFLENSVPLFLKTIEDRKYADMLIRKHLKHMTESNKKIALNEIEEKAGIALNKQSLDFSRYSPLMWEQVREMAESGLIEFGSHTTTHPILTYCTPAQITYELSESKKIIQDRLGTNCQYFAYPNGRPGDFNRLTRDTLLNSGYLCALTTVQGLTCKNSDPFTLPRFPVKATTSLNEFEKLLSGVSILMEQLQFPLSYLITKLRRSAKTVLRKSNISYEW